MGQQGISQGAKFLVTDAETGAALYSEEHRMTVFGRELNQLNAAGYTKVGDFMVPPGLK
jgi:hypothetical protein